MQTTLATGCAYHAPAAGMGEAGLAKSLGLLIAILALSVSAEAAEQPQRTSTTAASTIAMSAADQLLAAARDGSSAIIQDLLQTGIDVNGADERGRTALHYAAENGHVATAEALLKAGADPSRKDNGGLTARDLARQKGHDGTAAALRAAMGPDTPHGEGNRTLSPTAKYPDLASFERTIGEPALLLKSDHVWFFAPKSRETASRTVFPYLVKAYDELRRITGVDTEFVIAVYNLPANHPDVRGGTSQCVIWYDDGNLKLDEHEEWKKYRKPHVSGYIEEMAHNFVSTTKAQFGWEMIGWSIGAEVTTKVAGNPLHARQVSETRREQARTFQRYKAADFTFPPDLPSNQVDRIHAHLLRQCEQQYGKTFWPDFFKEVAKRQKDLRDAIRLGDGDPARNERYRITVECFDRLPKLGFKQMLEAAGISTTVDVKSLHPTEPGWNRKLK